MKTYFIAVSLAVFFIFCGVVALGANLWSAMAVAVLFYAYALFAGITHIYAARSS